MKIRIKGASIRMRLSKTEVATITTAGYLEEQTPFINNAFIYALQRTSAGNELYATFEAGKLTMFVPEILIKDWATNDLISIDSNMPTNDNGTLYLLLEKDFQCIDQTTEDQSDNYINPNKNC